MKQRGLGAELQLLALSLSLSLFLERASRRTIIYGIGFLVVISLLFSHDSVSHLSRKGAGLGFFMLRGNDYFVVCCVSEKGFMSKIMRSHVNLRRNTLRNSPRASEKVQVHSNMIIISRQRNFWLPFFSMFENDSSSPRRRENFDGFTFLDDETVRDL
jgi:hypothetical protein